MGRSAIASIVGEIFKYFPNAKRLAVMQNNNVRVQFRNGKKKSQETSTNRSKRILFERINFRRFNQSSSYSISKGGSFDDMQYEDDELQPKEIEDKSCYY